jgi:hypothetical protein
MNNKKQLTREQESCRYHSKNLRHYRESEQGKLSVLRLKIDLDSRFFVEKTVGFQSCNQIYEEVIYRAVARVFDISGVFKQIINRLNNRAFSQYNTVIEGHQAVFHIAFDAGNEMYAVVEKRFKKPLRDVSPVGKKFPE